MENVLTIPNGKLVLRFACDALCVKELADS